MRLGDNLEAEALDRILAHVAEGGALCTLHGKDGERSIEFPLVDILGFRTAELPFYLCLLEPGFMWQYGTIHMRKILHWTYHPSDLLATFYSAEGDNFSIEWPLEDSGEKWKGYLDNWCAYVADHPAEVEDSVSRIRKSCEGMIDPAEAGQNY